MAEVVLSPQAVRMLAEHDVWWIANRGFVENRLWQAIGRVMELLRDYPLIGVVYGRSGRGELVRRRLLDGGWHAYHWYDEARQVVTIIAIHHASRGSGPPL